MNDKSPTKKRARERRVKEIDRMTTSFYDADLTPYVVYFIINKGQSGMHKALGCQKTTVLALTSCSS